MSPLASRALFSALIPALALVFCGIAAAQQHITGTLPDGANYLMDVPAFWNGTLLL